MPKENHIFASDREEYLHKIILSRFKTDSMRKFGKYRENDRMCDLVGDNYPILPAIGRFGIGFGFEEKNIGEVCLVNGVDAKTFLAVINALLDFGDTTPDEGEIDLGQLLDYLHNSHEHFLNVTLPSIRIKLVGIVGTGSNLSKATVNYFDEYAAEVDRHMKYEEQVVFPYVRALLGKQKQVNYNIDIFSRQHERVEARLGEFKSIIIKYFPAQSTDEVTSMLLDIFNCERELAAHNSIEDRILVPAIIELESETDSGK